MFEKYPIIKRSSERRKGFPFLNEINPLHLFTGKKEFLCACNHMLPVASLTEPSVFNCPWKDYLFYCVCFKAIFTLN